jgi:hypothetical protein
MPTTFFPTLMLSSRGKGFTERSFGKRSGNQLAQVERLDRTVCSVDES